jgi:hypothetical protein
MTVPLYVRKDADVFSDFFRCDYKQKTGAFATRQTDGFLCQENQGT